jgi:hypothetical protein
MLQALWGQYQIRWSSVWPPRRHRRNAGQTGANLADPHSHPAPGTTMRAAVGTGEGMETKGAIPWATLYSASLREIDVKPGEARFVKMGRGPFAVASK